MIGWIIRVAGIALLFTNGETIKAILCILAIILASVLEEDAFWRWIILTTILFVGLVMIASFNFWLGVVAVVVCFFAALAPPPTPPERPHRNF
jgi:hypothetical protein